MSVIDSYIKRLSKKFPQTKEVREQLEEIRDTLNAKTEELQSEGMYFEDAAKMAIRSAGDMSGLLSMVAGETRAVYVNRLRRANALFVSIIITIEVLFGFAAAFGRVAIGLYDGQGNFDAVNNFLGHISFVNISLNAFWPMFIITMIAVWIWPVISIFAVLRDPHKTGTVQTLHKTLRMLSLFGWAAVALLLAAVNMANPHGGMWVVWPIIFLSNFPLIILNYHRLFMSGKFDA